MWRKRELLSESKLTGYFDRIKCGNIVPGWFWRTWLIVWFPEVVDRQNSGMSWYSCYKNIVYKHENASCVFSWSDFVLDNRSGLKKGKFYVCFSPAPSYEPHSLRDWKVIISVLLNVVHFVTNLSLLPRATFQVFPAINLFFLSHN